MGPSSVLRRVEKSIPRTRLFQMLFAPAKFARLMYHRLRYRLWILEGAERVSGEQLVLAYAGSSHTKSFIGGTVFGRSFREHPLGKVWVWDIRKKIGSCGFKPALFVYEVKKENRRFFPLESSLMLRDWIRMELDLTDNPETLFDKERYKAVLRKIEKNGFSAELTRSAADLDDFYHNMYLPYIRRRHEDEMISHGYAELKKIFFSSDCEILLVKRSGVAVGGYLILYSEDTPRLWYIGLRDGNDEFLRMGVVDVVYYFSCKRVQERGHHKVNLGGCRPFVGDGVVEYKRRLGGYLLNSFHESSGFICVRPLDRSKGVRDFLVNNPCVSSSEDGRIHLELFADSLGEGILRKAAEFSEKYCFKGTLDLRVHAIDRVPDDAVWAERLQALKGVSVAGVRERILPEESLP